LRRCEVTPEGLRFRSAHPSATSISDPSAALGLQHDVEATPRRRRRRQLRLKSDEDIDFNLEAELTKSASSSSRRTSAAAAWCQLGPRRVKLAGLVILTAALLLGGLQIRRREGAT